MGREATVREYERALLEDRLSFTVADVRQALSGRPLGCYCPLESPCHVDVLLRIADRPIDSSTALARQAFPLNAESLRKTEIFLRETSLMMTVMEVLETDKWPSLPPARADSFPARRSQLARGPHGAFHARTAGRRRRSR
jgi:Domain of unknown function (DUF4326)